MSVPIELVEAVAKSICNQTGEFIWDEEHEVLRSEFRNEARAAIDTMPGGFLTLDDLNLIRQWFNVVEDMTPGYLEAGDVALYAKLMAVMAKANPSWGPIAEAAALRARA